MHSSNFHQSFKQLISFKFSYKLTCPFISELFDIFVLASLSSPFPFLIFIDARNGEPSKFRLKEFIILSSFNNYQTINTDWWNQQKSNKSRSVKPICHLYLTLINKLETKVFRYLAFIQTSQLSSDSISLYLYCL